MPAKIITDSVNVASLDFAVLSDLCNGEFSVNLSSTVFIAGGAGPSGGVLGASVKITNPYGVVIKNYPTSGYDIYPPMTGSTEVDIPTQANNYQYGTYIFEVALTDDNGTVYTLSKPVPICAPDAKNKTRNYGTLSAQLNGVCKDGKVYIIADTPPTYKGAISDSQENAFTLEYPTSSGMEELETEIGNFSTQLFEGVYKFTGTICAHYSLGDNIFAQVNYKLKREKNIRCLLDETCIYAKLEQLDAQVKSDCTEIEKIDTQNTIIQALRLIKTIEVAASSGFDASDYIDELEATLGCVCTCNCADGTPIINNNPAKDFSITGCNVEKTTVGLTDTYVINSYNYVVEITPNGNAITITAPTLADCTKTQTITFNIGVVYSQIKAQITNSSEYNFWASIVNHSWDDLSISCLPNVTQLQWDTYTLAQRTQAILSQLCAGGSCNAQITADNVVNTAADVTVSWNNISNVYQVAAYLDGVLMGTVLSPIEQYKFVGAADGDEHDWTLVAKCTNGSIGNSLNGSFTYLGCPAIAAPTVTDANVEDATCPYDLTALVNALPMGITAEWHNLNNTHNSSLVANPTAATDGIYYVFAKDSNGCYSLGTQVILTCSTATACTAPQNLLVESIGGGFRVRFQTAAFPPPANSYTVKRRVKSDPDISGSYTTIGTPTWNSSVNRWEILDATASNNVLYVYRAISNCTSSAPSVDYSFANLSCPVVTLTSGDTTMGYSFTNAGGQIDKYLVKIYDATGTTLIHTDTVLPAFSSPITGTFVYLTSGTTYLVALSPFIGTYSKTCDYVIGSTNAADTITPPTYMNLANPTFSGTIVVTTVGGRTLRLTNYSSCGNDAVTLTISGGIGTIGNNITSGVPNATQIADIALPVGTYTYSGTLTAGCTSTASIAFI